MKIFTIKLNELLKVNKISRYKLAKDLGISQTAIKYWCEDTNEPKITYLKMIAEYFDVSADYLLGIEDYAGNKIATKNYIHNINNNGKLDIH